MSAADKQLYDDQVLIQYLLGGALPEDQTEHLDELSIADDQFTSSV